MKFSISLPIAAIALGLSLLISDPATAAYRFTKIADTNDERLDDLTGRAASFTAPLLNNAGTVLFNGSPRGSGGDLQFVFTGNGDTITTIATPALLPPIAPPNQVPIVFGTAINDNGTVAVITRRRIGSIELTDFLGLFISDGETITQISDRNSVGSFPNNIFFAGLNNNNTVVFWADNTLKINQSGENTPLNIPDVTPSLTFALSNDETLVFLGREASSPTRTDLFTLKGDTLTRLTSADPTQDLNSLSAFSALSINSQGTVAVLVALLNGTRKFLTVAADGTQTTIAAALFNGDLPFNRITTVAINNIDGVAFVAEPMGQPAALFKGPDPEADQVLSVGDELFDSTVRTLNISTKAINDAGQIAFVITLADGRSVIVRADPEVTEPPVDPDLNPDPTEAIDPEDDLLDLAL
jgi:hypothetical protein